MTAMRGHEKSAPRSRLGCAPAPGGTGGAPFWAVEDLMAAFRLETPRAARKAAEELGLPKVRIGRRDLWPARLVIARIEELARTGTA
jgi:hypothetical protein